MRAIISIAAIAAAIIIAGIVIASCGHTSRPAPSVTTVAPAPVPSPVPFTGPLPTYSPGA